MELDEISIFQTLSPVVRPIAAETRQAVEAAISQNLSDFNKEPVYRWASRPTEDVLRIGIDSFVLELVFLDRAVQFYGAAPVWAKLLFTKARQDQLADTAERVLQQTGFEVVRQAPAKVEARGWAARRKDKA